MKKIVGLLAAAAVLATSVFAADVSAKVRVGGNIFSYNSGVAAPTKDTKFPVNKNGDEASTFSLFNAGTVSHTYDAPFATLSTSTDNAGGTVKFVGDENGIKAGDVQVWFKPLDMIKIQAGSHDLALNKETIDWTEHHGEQAYGTYGYSIGYAQDAIALNVCLGTGNGGWFFQDKIAKYSSDADALSTYINDLYVNFTYGADFGTIGAFFRYQGKYFEDYKETKAAAASTTAVWTKDADHPDGYWKPTTAAAAASASGTFHPDTISFGASYKNTIDALTFFVNVVGKNRSAISDDELKIAKLTDKNGKPLVILDKNGKGRSAFGFGVDAFVEYTADALTVKGFVKYDTADFGNLNNKGDADIMYANNTIVEVLARLDYALDNGIGIFAYFKDANLLNKQTKAGDTDPYSSTVFASTIKVGAKGSVGIASWETALQLDTGICGAKGKYDKVNVSMPVFVQVAF